MDEITLGRVIGELVGEASTCWVGGTGSAVFDEQRANGVVVRLLALFNDIESFNRVRQFHVMGYAPVRDGLFDSDEIALRVRLIKEEFKELTDALKVWEAALPSGDIDALVEIADALADLDYVVQGALVSFGLPGVAIEKEVHRSNMTKFLQSGGVLKREDGKILKGPDFEPVDLVGVLVRAGVLRLDEEGNIYIADEFYPKEDDEPSTYST